MSAEAGASPAEVGKVSEVIGSGWAACECQGGCGSPNMASRSKPNVSEEVGSPRKLAEANRECKVGRESFRKG